MLAHRLIAMGREMSIFVRRQIKCIQAAVAAAFFLATAPIERASATDPLTILSLAIGVIDVSTASASPDDIDRLNGRLEEIMDGAATFREIVDDALADDRLTAYRREVLALHQRLGDCAAPSDFCRTEYETIAGEARRISSQLQTMNADPIVMTLMLMTQIVHFDAMQRFGYDAGDIEVNWRSYERYYDAQLDADASGSAAARLARFSDEQADAIEQAVGTRYDASIAATVEDMVAFAEWLRPRLVELVPGANMDGVHDGVIDCTYNMAAIDWVGRSTSEPYPPGMLVALFRFFASPDLIHRDDGFWRLDIDARVRRTQGVYPNDFRNIEHIWDSEGASRCHFWTGFTTPAQRFEDRLVQRGRSIERAANLNAVDIAVTQFVIAAAERGRALGVRARVAEHDAGRAAPSLPTIGSEESIFSRLGVQFAQRHGLNGVRVSWVNEYGEFAAAGWREGDIILSVGGVSVEYGAHVEALLDMHAGSTVEIAYLRNGAEAVMRFNMPAE